MGEQIVVRIGADTIFDLAAELGREFEHVKMLAAAGQQSLTKSEMAVRMSSMGIPRAPPASY